MSTTTLPPTGHTGGHLRDPFCELIETGALPADADHRGWPLSAWRLTGLLWNCTDTMPGDCCEMLDLRGGSSYAVGARELRRLLRIGRPPWA